MPLVKNYYRYRIISAHKGKLYSSDFIFDTHYNKHLHYLDVYNIPYIAYEKKGSRLDWDVQHLHRKGVVEDLIGKVPIIVTKERQKCNHCNQYSGECVNRNAFRALCPTCDRIQDYVDRVKKEHELEFPKAGWSNYQDENARTLARKELHKQQRIEYNKARGISLK